MKRFAFALALFASFVLGASAESRRATITTQAGEVMQGEFAGASATAVTISISGIRVDIPWSKVKAVEFDSATQGRTGGDPSSAAPPLRLSSSSSESTPKPVTSGRCQATTQKGTQCSRNAKAGSRYCWQHGS